MAEHTKRIFCEIVTLQVSLEKGAHLSVTRTGLVQDQEVNLEADKVNEKWEQD